MKISVRGQSERSPYKAKVDNGSPKDNGNLPKKGATPMMGSGERLAHVGDETLHRQIMTNASQIVMITICNHALERAAKGALWNLPD